MTQRRCRNFCSLCALPPTVACDFVDAMYKDGVKICLESRPRQLCFVQAYKVDLFP